jgi:hypothetical protein
MKKKGEIEGVVQIVSHLMLLGSLPGLLFYSFVPFFLILKNTSLTMLYPHGILENLRKCSYILSDEKQRNPRYETNILLYMCIIHILYIQNHKERL